MNPAWKPTTVRIPTSGAEQERALAPVGRVEHERERSDQQRAERDRPEHDGERSHPPHRLSEHRVGGAPADRREEPEDDRHQEAETRMVRAYADPLREARTLRGAVLRGSVIGHVVLADDVELLESGRIRAAAGGPFDRPHHRRTAADGVVDVPLLVARERTRVAVPGGDETRGGGLADASSAGTRRRREPSRPPVPASSWRCRSRASSSGTPSACRHRRDSRRATSERARRAARAAAPASPRRRRSRSSSRARRAASASRRALPARASERQREGDQQRGKQRTLVIRHNVVAET